MFEKEDNFDDDFNINYDIVSILRIEYDRVSEVSETDEDFLSDEASCEKTLCYYVMNSGVVEVQKAIFENLSQ